DDPFQIITHLMVGSEGTLAFISEVTMKTGHLYPLSASAMLYFNDIAEACRAVVAMRRDAPVVSCELLDSHSLDAVGDTIGSGLTALLVEVKADDDATLHSHIDTTMQVLSGFNMFCPAKFSTDPQQCAAWWNMRSGIFPAVGGTRPLGTTVLIEDIAFHIEDLPEATASLLNILDSSGYENACIYGHALEGNYHFIISQKFETKADYERYTHLMLDIKHLVVDRFGGSLKAEHGTGRNMAPFVEMEWGSHASRLMREVKQLFDPDCLLNPGVIFNNDPNCYIENTKVLTPVDPAVDRCIECGFCEPACVSCGFTLSARQRIVAAREIQRRRNADPSDPMIALLEKQFRYPGIETCAGDGLCSLPCPMSIRTGELVHHLRQKMSPQGSAAWKAGKFAADHLAGISSALRVTLSCALAARTVIGPKGVNIVGRMLHKAGMPLWTSDLPRPNRFKEQPQTPQQRKVVYFPSCINRTMGAAPGKTDDEPLTDVMLRLLNKAGFEVIYPENLKKLCCGMIWASKGMPDIAEQKTRELEDALWKASDSGRWPVLCDQSPCLHRMRKTISKMHLFEPAEFIMTHLADRLKFTPVDTPVAVHVTCSTRMMGLADTIISLARKCSTDVTVPEGVGCCGFAGDKGFTHPELNRWGLRKLREALLSAKVVEGYSNSRTCEIGLTTNGGVPYRSIVYLVDKVTSPVE
ncbi:MAG: 4Fe-4S dicluster domain-containing protein, partial [Muribaculaceae bacterium]|nr:4Fe-4S dicluster domain-containing protein [Muribaculaceae bacterium]